MRVEAFAPGRVNLIGDHTDHTGGHVLPIAVAQGTTVAGERGGPVVRLRSDAAAGEAVIPLHGAEPSPVGPPWARYVAGVVAELGPSTGLSGEVASTLPLGAGLSSSASLEVATALALGADPTDVTGVATLCQRAEHRAVGVPCGVMDHLAVMAAVEGAALLIDTGSLEWESVPLPLDAEIVVVGSGETRTLAGSEYARIRERCVGGEPDAVHHVESENQRVLETAASLRSGDLERAGALMQESHWSLRRLGVSTRRLDALVQRLVAVPGVHGARLTGAGFGGSVVALCAPGALDEGQVVRASANAWVTLG